MVSFRKFSKSAGKKTLIPPMNLRLGGPKLLVTVFFSLQVTYDKTSNSSLHVTTSNVERFSWSLSRRGNAATWPSDRRLVAGPRSKWGPLLGGSSPFPWISMVYRVYVSIDEWLIFMGNVGKYAMGFSMWWIIMVSFSPRIRCWSSYKWREVYPLNKPRILSGMILQVPPPQVSP